MIYAPIPVKRCRKCGLLLPLLSFYKSSNRKDGFRNSCKDCDAARKGRKLRPIKRTDGFKPCARCARELPLSEFYKHSGRPDGCGPYCKDCVNAINGSRARRPRAKAGEGKKRCAGCQREFPATLEFFYFNKNRKVGLLSRCKECTRDRARRNRLTPAAHASAQSPKRKAQQLAYRQRPQVRAATRARCQQRRALKRALPAAFTTQDWQRCLDYWRGCCAYCGKQRGLWQTELAQDHFTPLTKGGGYTPDNIVPACNGLDGCNQSKSNLDPIEWLIAKFGQRKARQKLAEIAAYFAWVGNQE